MATGSIFTNNKTQAVRIPAEVRFPDDVKRVYICKVGEALILSPEGHSWDYFFTTDEFTGDDTLIERCEQIASSREELD